MKRTRVTETSKQNQKKSEHTSTCNYMSGRVSATGEGHSFISVWISEGLRQFLPQYKHFVSSRVLCGVHNSEMKGQTLCT